MCVDPYENRVYCNFNGWNHFSIFAFCMFISNGIKKCLMTQFVLQLRSHLAINGKTNLGNLDVKMLINKSQCIAHNHFVNGKLARSLAYRKEMKMKKGKITMFPVGRKQLVSRRPEKKECGKCRNHLRICKICSERTR